MTLNDKLLSVLRGQAYIPTPLLDYNAAQAVKAALRRKCPNARLSGVREALRQYRVTAWHGGDGPRGIVLRVNGADVLAL